MKIKDFYKNEFPSFALYDSYRKIACYVDGMKPSSRKILNTVIKRNIKSPQKVASLASLVSSDNEYLHGQVSLEDVIVGMAQDFPSTNNINVLIPEGSFGNRTIPDAAASRYIFTFKSPLNDLIFKKEDYDILIKQNFEGTEIEPRFFVPIIPMLLVNGNEGTGNGFAQKILPRNPISLIKLICEKLKGTNIDTEPEFDKLKLPYYQGFTGKIIDVSIDDKSKYEIIGRFERKNTSSFLITELPVNYKLSSYIKVLDKLEEDKVIKSYVDRSEDNTFLFEVKCEREFLKQDDRTILETLKLVQKVTENYTCFDQYNVIKEFQNMDEILDDYIKIRLSYYETRRNHLLNELQEQLNVASSKYNFVLNVIDNKIKVYKKTKQEISDQLENMKYYLVNGSYSYILSMPIHSFSIETLESLKKDQEKLIDGIAALKNTNAKKMWITELKELYKQLKGNFDALS